MYAQKDTVKRQRGPSHQITIPVSSKAYKALKLACYELGCPMRELMLDAIATAVDDYAYDGES